MPKMNLIRHKTKIKLRKLISYELFRNKKIKNLVILERSEESGGVEQSPFGKKPALNPIPKLPPIDIEANIL